MLGWEGATTHSLVCTGNAGKVFAVTDGDTERSGRNRRKRTEKRHEKRLREQETGAHLLSIRVRGRRVEAGDRHVQPPASRRGGAAPPARVGEVAGRGRHGLRGQQEAGLVPDAAAEGRVAVEVDRRDAGRDDGSGEGELTRSRAREVP